LALAFIFGQYIQGLSLDESHQAVSFSFFSLSSSFTSMSDVGDVDSLLDSLMDDAEGVSFVVVGGESASRTPSPAVQARAMGVRSGSQALGVGGITSRMQGTISTSGKSYSIVRVTGSDRSVCFGVVGKGGGAFCIRKNCGVSSHADDKIPFKGMEETCYFICRGGEGNTVIYSQPSVDERRVPEEVRKVWMIQQKTLGEWRLAFRAVDNADDVGASADEIKKEVSRLPTSDLQQKRGKKLC
jgi:hypothetical protein